MSKVKFEFKDVSQPFNGAIAYVGYYWMCENGDPSRALFFGDSPQCNKDQRIVNNSIGKDLWQSASKNLSIVHIPVAYLNQRS